MSRENVEIVNGLFEAVNTRHFADVFGLYADDVVLAHHGEVIAIAGEEVVGKEAVGRWYDDWFATFDRDYRFEVQETEEVEGVGDLVLVVAVHNARGRASGVTIERSMAWIYTLREGKIVRCDVYENKAQALAATSEGHR